MHWLQWKKRWDMNMSESRVSEFDKKAPRKHSSEKGKKNPVRSPQTQVQRTCTPCTATLWWFNEHIRWSGWRGQGFLWSTVLKVSVLVGPVGSGLLLKQYLRAQACAHFMAANKQRWELLRSKYFLKGMFPVPWLLSLPPTAQRFHHVP